MTGTSLLSHKATPERLEQMNFVSLIRMKNIRLWSCGLQQPEQGLGPSGFSREKAELCCLGKLLVDLSHWEFKQPDFSSTPTCFKRPFVCMLNLMG